MAGLPCDGALIDELFSPPGDATLVGDREMTVAAGMQQNRGVICFVDSTTRKGSHQLPPTPQQEG